MKISFHGAAREVTGSCHRIEVNGARILLDCGMIQGGKERHERNREPFPFEPRELDCVVLSHAHIDHSGRLPLLRRGGYTGPILATPATVELVQILLRDAAHIQEEDARWKIKRLRKQRLEHKWVKPLYTGDDVEQVLQQLVPVEFNRPYDLTGRGTLRFIEAGHILGAAIVELTLTEQGKTRRVVFSGDLGVEGARLLGVPKVVERPDILLIESTYGDRVRDEQGERTTFIHDVIRRAIDRRGKVVIPSFAVGRTQEILARINDLVEDGRLRGVPVYVDSPMAVAATGIFARHPEAYSREARQKLHAGDKPLEFPGLQLVTRVEDSMAINELDGPAVIISASGMCTAGRIKHHLRHNIADPRCTVLFVGYQAQGSLGRLIQSGVSPVRIFGEWYPVRARVESIEGLSAHADLDELLQWFEGLQGLPQRTFVVHGEEEAAMSFASTLRNRYGAKVDVPRRHEEFQID